MVFLCDIFVFAIGFQLMTVQHVSTVLPHNSLKLVHVLFRHGDRTVDANTAYETDPYARETYSPYGHGELTRKGKQREYNLGKILRNRYNNFLGPSYTPTILEGFTTQMDRTKMSLQLVLAGCFPPKHTSMEWDTNLNWQPIPFNELQFGRDHLLAPAIFFCPAYVKMLSIYLTSREGEMMERKYTELFKYLSENTGDNVRSVADVFGLYFTLVVEEEWGFKLPSWTKPVFPRYMKEAAIDFYYATIATAPLRQLAGGFLLRKIISDSKLKLSGKLVPQDRKIFLYSGHEVNVVALLGAMGVYFPHIPPYGACVMIEVHTINNVDGIKIFYEDYSEEEPRLLIVPTCDCFCPLDQFVRILEKNIPPEDEMC